MIWPQDIFDSLFEPLPIYADSNGYKVVDFLVF